VTEFRYGCCSAVLEFIFK